MLDDWDHYFPACEPIGFRLREAYPLRWARLHSLPESKRYPEGDDDYGEVLARHNAILGELTHPGEQFVLVTTGYSATPIPTRSYLEVLAFDPGATPWRTVAKHSVTEEFIDPSYWHMFASVQKWRPGTFDSLVRLIANGEVANVLVVAPDCRWILHPYDGGMDVIVESPETSQRLRNRYSDWLSARPDGL